MRIKDLFNTEDGSELDRKSIVICVLAALSLSMNKYLPGTADLFQDTELWKICFSNDQLSDLANWVLVLFVFYFLIPALVVKLFFKENLRDYGLKLKGAFSQYWIYLAMLFVMVPLVLYFSTTAAFQAKYPFYDPAPGEKLWPNFWIWQVLYFLQFFALEFFFRGFMVHGLKHRFGIYSVLVMMIPYCMIHFGKPLPETLAAIIAGIVLGLLSLRTRSVLLGVAIHYSVGLMMDLSALWHKLPQP